MFITLNKVFNRSDLKLLEKWWILVDKKLLFSYFTFIALGCLFIFTASSAVALRINLEPHHFLYKQLIYIALSVFITLTTSLLNERLTLATAILGFTTSIILLLLVEFFGFATKGSRRWLYIAGFSLQPSELVKPLMVVVNAYILATVQNTKKKLVLSGCVFAVPALLIFKQPDLGTFLLLTAIYGAQLFIANIPIKYFMALGGAAMVLLIIAFFTFSHVSSRIIRFVAGLYGQSGGNYQVSVALDAYRNGGWLGRGLLEGNVKSYIPDSHTDFIFPVVAEEFGFLFALMVMTMYFYVAIRVMLKLKKNNCSNFKYYTIFGLALVFITQAFINIGVSLNLLPTKGMTLPFLSYGGSSLMGVSLTFGYLLALTKKNFDTKTELTDVLE